MIDWITHWIESLGYIGIFGLMVLEHMFPPIPSELIMPLSGFTSSYSADINLGLVILVGSLGSMVGTSVWYVLGHCISHEQMIHWVKQYGRWLALDPNDVQKAIAFFQDGKGTWIVGLGRVVPGIRTYVSIPAGLSHMPLVPYLVYSTLGTVLWTGTLAIAGYVLGEQFDQVREFIAPISKGVLISLGIIAIIWVIKRFRNFY
jgi:membrane protein DedA with SNARE-associated domain